MHQGLRWIWALFKWSMVALGVFVAWAALFRKPGDEVFFMGGTNCDFSFELPQGEWTSDPNSASYTNLPVMVRKSELAHPSLFLSMNRTYWSDKTPGGGDFASIEKCQLAKQDVIRTKDGKEARVFLASNCGASAPLRGGQSGTPFWRHTLYGYVVFNEKEADFLYLSSRDPALVSKHQDLLRSAPKSYSTSSPKCIARRTTVKKLEVTR